MYVPRHFAEDGPVELLAMVRSAGYGHLVVVGDDGLTATPMPFLVDDDLTVVRAHLARANPVWRTAPCDALLIVPTVDAYVSPGWYPSKAEHGRVVPTWNYEVVHLHGRLVAHDEAEWVGRLVRDLTEIHEARLPDPWSVDDAPPEFVDAQLRAIVGIELDVARVEGKRKLSQNRSEADRTGAIAGLRSQGDPRSTTLADTM